MRATFDRELLVAALSGIAGVVPARSPKAALQGVLLTVDDAGATVEATDLEVWCRRRVAHGVKVGASGRAVLPIPRLLDALRKCDDAEASIEADEARAVVKVGRSTFTMQTHDPMEWPSNDDQWARLESPAFRVAAADLRKAFARTENCTDPTSTRYALGGVILGYGGGPLDVVATDGRRLAWQHLDVEPGGAEWPDPAPVVPVTAAALVRKNADDDDVLDVSADASAVLFRGPRSSVLCRRKEGRLPAWQRMYPPSPASTARFDRAERLLGLVERASVMTTPLTNGVGLLLADGELVASASSPDVGGSESPEPCEVSGPATRVVVQVGHLASCLRTLDRESPVSLGLDPRAVLVRTEDGFTGSVATLNIQE